MLPLGSILPSFELPLVSDVTLHSDPFDQGAKCFSSSELSSRPLLLMVLCAHCPFVKHIEVGLTALQSDYGDRVEMVAVSSNSLRTHPQDAPKYLAEQAKENDWMFPYLFDQNQSLAKALKAACTPDFYLFSEAGDVHKQLKYRGQLDASRPGNDQPVTGIDLRAALDFVLRGEVVCPDQKPSIGCNIKWHPGQEPHWFR